MPRSRAICVALLLALVASEAQARYCSSPYCSMCNRLFGLMPGYTYSNGRVVKKSSSTRRTSTSTRPRPTTPSKPKIESTPQEIVDVMLALAFLKPDDVLLDAGCGDGRFLIAAVQRYGCRAIGVEISDSAADKAEQAVADAGVGDRVLIVRGDVTTMSFGIATAVVVYQFPETIRAMAPRWPNATRVLSYMHELPGVENRKLDFDGQIVYMSEGVAK